jgi:hypothetical protein
VTELLQELLLSHLYRTVLLCSLPLFTSFLPPTSGYRRTLTSYVSTAFTFISLVSMGLAQRGVGKVS